MTNAAYTTVFSKVIDGETYEFTSLELVTVVQRFADRSTCWLRMQYIERTQCSPADLLFIERDDLLVMHADITPIDR